MMMHGKNADVICILFEVCLRVHVKYLRESFVEFE